MVFASSRHPSRRTNKALLGLFIGLLHAASTSSQSPPKCPIPKLAPHTNSDVRSPSLENTKAFFWCDEGFVLKGDNESVCMRNAEWKPPAPFCQSPNNVTCEFPARGPYVLHNVTSYPVYPGTVAGYKCDIGYILVGPAVRLCTRHGNWTESDPICAAWISAGRRIALVSPNVDVTMPLSQRGMSILDSINSRCSTADSSDHTDSYWTIDLLEKQTVDIVRIIFDNRINVNITLLASWKEGEKPREFSDKDFTISRWWARSVSGQVTTYEYRFKKSENLRYLTVQLLQSHLPRIYLCEVMVMSEKASSFGQCWNTKDPWRGKDSVTVANGTCFTLVQSEELGWKNAQFSCEDRGNGSLASHVTLDQQRLLTSHLAISDASDVDNFWIGGHANIGAKGQEDWKWLDGSQIQQTFWGRDQPSLHSSFKPCITMSRTMQWDWDDEPCEDLFHFICTHEILSCGQPDVPANTFLHGDRLDRFDSIISEIGTKVKYSCPKNYIMEEQNAERICRKGGKWSGKAPSCYRKDDPNNRQKHNEAQKKAAFPVGAIIAIVAGVILGILLIVAIVLFIGYKKKHGGTSMKYSTKTQSAETLDVEGKKGSGGTPNYASTGER